MKKHVAITIDDALYAISKNKTTNFSRYIENLIQADMFDSYRKRIVRAVADDLVGDEKFVAELSARLSRPLINKLDTSPVSPTVRPKEEEFVPKPPDPITGYPCCQKASPCKHWHYDELDSVWVNEITKATREP